MKIYKRYSTAASVYVRLDGKARWLERKPFPYVIETASFQAILRSGPSYHLTRRFELGRVDKYYSAVHRGIGSNALIYLYSSEQQARQEYEDAVNRCDEDVRWQRI